MKRQYKVGDLIRVRRVVSYPTELIGKTLTITNIDGDGRIYTDWLLPNGKYVCYYSGDTQFFEYLGEPACETYEIY